MDRVALRDAVYKLQELPSAPIGNAYAYDQAIKQFSSLLELAKTLYPNRADIQAMKGYETSIVVSKVNLDDAIRRLKHALDLRPFSSAGEKLAQFKLPSDAPDDVLLDMSELEGAVSLELTKTALLLVGSIAEALLLSRHPDKSDRGPGLKKLVDQARDQHLFGRDTLRNLETLIEYRDLIHPRAEKRNQTFRSQARVDTAVTALKLLCNELEDPDVRYT
jgi:tetratricopeptide (TPR) repeat protein